MKINVHLISLILRVRYLTPQNTILNARVSRNLIVTSTSQAQVILPPQSCPSPFTAHPQPHTTTSK